MRLTVDLGDAAASPRSRCTQGMDGARSAGRPRSAATTSRPTPARWWCSTPAPAQWWRWRRTRASTPTTSSRATPTSTSQDPNNAADQPRAQRPTRRARRSRRSRRSRCCRTAACSPTAPGTRRTATTPTAASTSATTRKRCNAGECGARHRRPPGRAHGVERRVLLHGRQRVLERLPRRGQGASGQHRRDLAGDWLPDAQHPVGNAIQHIAARTGSASRRASVSATRRRPRPRVPGELNPNDDESGA